MESSELAGLVAEVDAVFVDRDPQLVSWPRPHWPSPPDDAYSRVTDPAKYLIAGARVDAWVEVLTQHGVAQLEPSASVTWADDDHNGHETTERLVPIAADALPLVIGRSSLDGVPGAAVELGVGDPAVVVARGDCLCDACDSGSDDLLEVLDEQIVAVVSGTFRRLTNGDRTITQMNGSMSSARGQFRPRIPTLGDRVRRLPDIDEVLANPTGWVEVTGAAWI